MGSKQIAVGDLHFSFAGGEITFLLATVLLALVGIVYMRRRKDCDILVFLPAACVLLSGLCIAMLRGETLHTRDALTASGFRIVAVHTIEDNVIVRTRCGRTLKITGGYRIDSQGKRVFQGLNPIRQYRRPADLPC